MSARGLGWIGIARLGLVQAGLGSIVVLTTSTMNRIMVVELALPAIVPGALVGLHYAVQLLRPMWGHGSDAGARRRTPWIIGGMGVLALGGFAAACATAWIGADPLAGLLLAIAAFVLIGLGVGAAGTSLLALVASHADAGKRAGAATLMWLMMIAGIVATAVTAGQNLDPYMPQRLILVTAAIAAAALLLTILALWGVERSVAPDAAPERGDPSAARHSFRDAFMQVWNEPEARRFTVFVFVSMLAYSAQDLILEPFAGSVFAMTPGESTKLAGVQHGGVFVGMLLAGLLCGARSRFRIGTLKGWSVGGCIASAAALFGLAFGAIQAPAWPLKANVFALGAANGAFAVAAIGSMMELATAGRERSEGVRMGLWGAAQAIAFGLGGFLGTLAADLARAFVASDAAAYAGVFYAEALLFIASAALAADVIRLRNRTSAGVASDATGIVRMRTARG
jgi:MFS transporter, BCD family, chlorophyll transporter